MTVSKSIAPSSASSHLSILGTHPHPHLHPHHLKNSSLSSTSVTKTNVDTTTTMRSLSSSSFVKDNDAKSSAISENKISKNPSSWDPQDDILLRHLKEVKKLGWKDISQYFTNRTPNACQFRWRRLKSGNLKSNKTANVDVTEYPGNMKVVNSNQNDHENQTIFATANSIPPVETKTSVPSSAVEIPDIIPVGNPSGPSKIPLSHEGHSSAQNSTSTTQLSSSSRSPFSMSTSNSNINNMMNNNHGAGSKYFKSRSNSHSLSKSLNNNSTSLTLPPEEENIGFIPKIIVRSRRSSFAHPQALSTPAVASSNLTSALNTTLNSTKSRKNSFASRSRRSSFNVPSNTPSRRSSMVMAPNSLSAMFGLSTGSSTPKIPRRDSTVKKEFYVHRSASSSSASFMDLPLSSIPHFHRRASRSHLKQQPTNYTAHVPNSSTNRMRWSSEEDQLLSENGSRHLSITELSILLPNRSEKEIQWRLESVSTDNSSMGPNELTQSPLHSLRKSITPEDTAIDEDTCDDGEHGNDDDDENIDPLQNTHSPTPLLNETTPSSIISSTTTNDDVPHGAGETSRTNNNGEFTINNLHSQSSSNGFAPSSNATPLPGISSILKGTL